MTKFTKRELLLIGSLTTICWVELWQCRRLKRVASTIEDFSRLSLTVTRIAQKIRSLLDVEEILKVTIEEIVPAFSADQCVVRIEGDDGAPALVKCYSVGGDSALMSDFDSYRTVIEDDDLHHYVRQGHAREHDNTSTSGMTKPVLGAPIAYGGQFLGTLMVRSNNPARIWSESEVQALLGVAHQVWEALSQARLFAEKAQQSLTDALTGCLNRRGFDTKLETDLRLAAETGQLLSLVIIDIDHFKHVNDTYGHTTGDRVLRALAGVLRAEINGGAATTARFGGEEFALILPRRNIEEACTLADRIRAHLASTKVNGIDNAITASFGVATFPLHGSSRISLIESADAALYQAKRTGRNRVCASQANILRHDSSTVAR